MLLQCTTELEAVNTILRASGDSPTNTLAGPHRPQVSAAYAALIEASRDVQTVGWNFNTDNEYTLIRNDVGEIAVPADCLSIDVSPSDASIDIVQRANKLYDRTNKTFTLDRDLRCDITWFQPFEELPQAARTYILRKAGRRYQAGSVGSELLYKFTQVDEDEARDVLLRVHGLTEGNNMLYDSYTVSRILRRNPNNADF